MSCACLFLVKRKRSNRYSNRVTNQNNIPNLPYQLCPTHAQGTNISIYDLKAYLKLRLYFSKKKKKTTH